MPCARSRMHLAWIPGAGVDRYGRFEVPVYLLLHDLTTS